MGLLSRIGRGALKPGYETGVAAADTLIAGTGGGLIGALSSLNDPEDLGRNVLKGGALGGALGAGFGVKRMIMALAKEMKRMRPEVPDEQILKAAEEAAYRSMQNGQ